MGAIYARAGWLALVLPFLLAGCLPAAIPTNAPAAITPALPEPTTPSSPADKSAVGTPVVIAPASGLRFLEFYSPL